MKVFIFCAGMGTRLKPITDTIPKALVQVNNKSLIEHAILLFLKYNIKDFVINVHHFAHKIIDKCKLLEQQYGINIQISDETEKLLETGGALKKAKNFLCSEKFFITYNVDVLSNINVNDLISFHAKNDCIATVVTRERITHRYFLFNECNYLCGWENIQTGEKIIKNNFYKKLNRYAFSGISVISSEIFNYTNSFNEVFTLTQLFLEVCPNRNIISFIDNYSFWYEIGTLDKYNKINNSNFINLQ
ncbi:MAG: sugar phosphate nucleotidyltransferase [Bacteroidales bacterium]|nr:sugar phosphate nucleotidyltransferase [Bacteroidales bacterium]